MIRFIGRGDFTGAPQFDNLASAVEWAKTRILLKRGWTIEPHPIPNGVRLEVRNNNGRPVHVVTVTDYRIWQTVTALDLRVGDVIRRDLGHGPEEARVERTRRGQGVVYLRLAEHGTVVSRAMGNADTCERKVTS